MEYSRARRGGVVWRTSARSIEQSGVADGHARSVRASGTSWQCRHKVAGYGITIPRSSIKQPSGNSMR